MTDRATPVIDPHEVRFLAPAALAVTVAAQVADPGRPRDLLVALPGLLAFVFQGRLQRLPPEVRAAAMVGPLTAAVWSSGGRLEPLLFVAVTGILYVAESTRPVVRAATIALAAAATVPLMAVTHPAYGLGWQSWSFAYVFTFLVGVGVGEQRRLIANQRRLIAELDAARRELAEQAVAEERRRIARELHDLTGHSLAAMLLHVTGARHVLRRDPDEADRALADAEHVGRASMDQVRATVAALRTTESGTDPALAGARDLAGLIDGYRRAGLTIDAEVDGSVADLDGPVGTALHRITGEALANVARHARTNRVDLRADVDGDTVHLRVEDHGEAAPAGPVADGHFGLVGMRERARALGGVLHAGPTVDGWRVDAHLPVPAAGARPDANEDGDEDEGEEER